MRLTLYKRGVELWTLEMTGRDCPCEEIEGEFVRLSDGSIVALDDDDEECDEDCPGCAKPLPFGFSPRL